MADVRHTGAQRVTRSETTTKVVDFVVVTVCTLAFALNAGGILTSLLTDGFAGQRDFLTYWCSGVQLVRHQNPYDEVAIGTLERSVGFSPALRPLIMRNAPYALLAVYPLGFFTLRVASLIWSACMIAAAWWSVYIIADLYGGKGNKANLFAIAFAPILSCLISGQMALFSLLGLTLFLKFIKARPFLAGASLWLCALKPQDFVPFGVVLIIWCVLRRSFAVLWGVSAALVASLAIVRALDPSAWGEYFRMMSAAGIPNAFIPCLSTMLRVAISPSATWLQWVPITGACIWAVWYLRRHREWGWLERSPLLMLVSVVAAPYSWFMDQSILLPALLPILYRRVSRAVIWSFVLFSAAVEWANIFGVPLGNKLFYPWTASIWTVWYLCAARSARRANGDGLAGDRGVTTVSQT